MESIDRFFVETSSERSSRVKQLPSDISPKHNLLIVGCGLIGREHMRVATLLGRARIHGIYDINKASLDTAESTFKTYSDEKLVRYKNLQLACMDDAIDAILICTPNFTHFQVLKVVLESGKPLFVEKPMATTLEDGARIVEISRDYSSPIQIGMQYRYKAQYVDAFHEVKQLNSLGGVKTISMAEYRPPFLDKVEQWNKFKEFSGGTLVEKCCHYFDLINLMAEAKPTHVYANGGQAVNFLDFEYAGRKSDIDDNAFVTIQYGNGVRANFILNMFANELYEELIVTGEKGRLVASEHASFDRQKSSKAEIMVEVPDHQRYTPQDITYPELVERSGHHGATYFEHEALIDQLEGKRVDSATVEQGFRAMLVASAAQQSIECGEVIDIEEYTNKQGLTDLC